MGLVLFVALAAGRAIYMILIANKYPDRASLVVVVFLAAIVATLVNSQAHQMFHFRVLWVVLALQEAMLFKMALSDSGAEPTSRALNMIPGADRRFIVQTDITGG